MMRAGSTLLLLLTETSSSGDAACLSVPYEMLKIRSEGMAAVGAVCVVSS